MSHRLELSRDEHAPATARWALGELIADCGPATVADARLLVSELVTNSVVHGGGEMITVHIDSDRAGTLRCEVIDDGDGFVPRGREDRLIGGWGLELVDQIADNWGVRRGSTHVWFELSVG